MGFEREHNEWLCNHLKQRKGERLDALKRGHGYGNRLFVERVWWPLAGHFHGLHPEYEVKDWRGRSYFVDILWEIGARVLHLRSWTMAHMERIVANTGWT